MSHYQRHVFFCCNQRSPGECCCAQGDAEKMYLYAKDRVKALRLTDDNRVRINRAGCFGRCEDGPCLVVYPEAVWYTYRSAADLDEIIEQHLSSGRIVERLQF
ncbi:MAG: NAD(P)H-dependent oxidoreductase subunit E [Proteobacteria bacterium]|nr:NAD(P)H-dependent oxidoreductase subunit E [Pseudomonadota bacterium]MCL2308309.1 NAD(P)H-dependent oxidoreductase subunit E [Pseudomonadota bacterium]